MEICNKILTVINDGKQCIAVVKVILHYKKIISLCSLPARAPLMLMQQSNSQYLFMIHI